MLFEFKSPHSQGEMISPGDFNRKALHQLLYAYLEERIVKGNDDLKYLIASNFKN